MTKPRGFAALSPERRREISSKAGRAVQASGNARRWTPEEAKAAGRKGGLASSRRRQIADPVHGDYPSVGHDVPGGGAI